MAFEKGQKVSINHPFLESGSTGVIQEVHRINDTEHEYHVLVDGEKRPRVFGEHSLNDNTTEEN